MRMVIVTGMSGAGKSTALKILEDYGYFCADNLPVELLLQYAMVNETREDRDKVAVGLDVRNGDALKKLPEILKDPYFAVHPCEILYLDASDDILVHRFKETRRMHPMQRIGSIAEGIAWERDALADLRKVANYIIDTSRLLTRDLHQEMEKIFVRGEEYSSLNVSIVSFGFKHGIPSDADLVMDVRFLPNPFYIEEMRPLTGLDELVAGYVLSFPATQTFLEKLTDLIRFLLPQYALEGRNRFVLAVGCTGGRHRSVTIAEALYSRLSGGSYGLHVSHRELTEHR